IEGVGNLPEQFGAEPFMTAGTLGGSVVGQSLIIGGALKGVRKGIDVYRTKGLIELPFEDVVAPEFLKGQTFPEIKKGQTAKEHLEEFKPKNIYGVTELKGFTASPKPFAKTTEAGVGSSQLAGVYQAPKLSPQFLRVAGAERDLFRIGLKETWRPSITRITPEDFELTPFIKESQTTPASSRASVKQAQQFFKKQAKKGKSYVPFIKSEKEAIIPAGTPLKQTQKRFFVKYKGRRIPLFEYDTIPLSTEIPKVVKGKTSKSPLSEPPLRAEDIEKNLKSTRAGSRALLSQTELTYLGISSKSLKSKSSSVALNSYLKSIDSSMGSGVSKVSSGVSSVRDTPSSNIPSYVSSPKTSRSSRAGRPSESPPEPPVKPFRFKRKKIVVEKPSTKKKGYNVFIKRKGKYKKVTPVPIGLTDSRDLRAYGLDRSTARSGRILPTKKSASPSPYDIPRGYAEQTKRKFRAFKQKKKKRTRLKRTIIERGKYLIDSRGEELGLSYAKLLKQRR
ncbi:hypothetical protein LCGC14_2478820, partial [marine sediment metagenome]